MIKIEIQSLKTHPRISLRKLKSVAIKVFEFELVPSDKDYEICVTLVDDKYIRKLNKKYRKVDSPTDVIVFPIQVSGKLLGDIYISLDRAAQQIQENESLEIEVYRLLIHGLLHLLGYEHSQEMFTKQENYLWNTYLK